MNASLSNVESLSFSQGSMVPCFPVLCLGLHFFPANVPNADCLPTAFLGLQISTAPRFPYWAQPWASLVPPALTITVLVSEPPHDSSSGPDVLAFLARFVLLLTSTCVGFPDSIISPSFLFF